MPSNGDPELYVAVLHGEADAGSGREPSSAAAVEACQSCSRISSTALTCMDARGRTLKYSGSRVRAASMAAVACRRYSARPAGPSGR
jgi:hypothetical protein